MVSAKVTVVDYGVGNILSIKRALEHCGADVELTDEHGRILEANRIILPGVGAFKSAMVALENLGLDEVIREIANRQIPLMGICLGMQLLLDQSSEFGIKKGLGMHYGVRAQQVFKTLFFRIINLRKRFILFIHLWSRLRMSIIALQIMTLVGTLLLL